MTVVEGGADLVPLVNVSQTLWSKTQSDDSSASTCLAILPFQIPFPKDYTDARGSRPLPPTFLAQFSSTPGIYVECKYTLSVTVTKTGLGGWKRQKV